MDKPRDLLGKENTVEMQYKTIGESLAALEADHELVAGYPFPELKVTLLVRAIAPQIFFVTVQAEGEDESCGLLAADKLAELLAKMTIVNTAKRGAGLGDEAEAFLRSQS